MKPLNPTILAPSAEHALEHLLANQTSITYRANSSLQLSGTYLARQTLLVAIIAVVKAKTPGALELEDKWNHVMASIYGKDTAQVINLPKFIDELSQWLASPTGQWPTRDKADFPEFRINEEVTVIPHAHSIAAILKESGLNKISGIAGLPTPRVPAAA